MKIPLTLDNAFEIGLICTREIYKGEPRERQREAELDYAIRFLDKLSKIRIKLFYLF